jgi:hypothetical protein
MGWGIGTALALVGCASGSSEIQRPSETGALLYGSVELPVRVRDQLQRLASSRTTQRM